MTAQPDAALPTTADTRVPAGRNTEMPNEAPAPPLPNTALPPEPPAMVKVAEQPPTAGAK